MVTQSQLFIDSLAEALDEAISQLGGRKAVGLMLWPEKLATTAGNNLGDCLNPENRNKLSLEQLEFIFSEARKKDVHVIADYFGKRYGYQITPIEPEDEKAKLYRDYIKATEVLSDIATRLEKIDQLRAVG